jgi:tRNA 2-selenouridine synthase
MGCLGSDFDTLEKAKEVVEARSWPASRRLSVDHFTWNSQGCQLNSETLAIFDVRSPDEFKQGHIPGAKNLPLLDDDARAEVGKCFRHDGQGEALDMALRKAYPGLETLLMNAHNQSLKPNAIETNSVLVYCKRGGLRSQSVATLLASHGLTVYTIQDGYKAFRNWAGAALVRQQKVCMIGGACGSGKTELLSELKCRGRQVIDLEALACHKGSVFGHLGEAQQPTSEQFRNLVAVEWASLDPSRFVYMEDEHARIGSVVIDASLYRHMRQPTMLICLQVPFQLRVERVLAQYGPHGSEALSQAVKLFQKRIGLERTRILLNHIESGDLQPVCESSLRTYDVAYEKHLHKDRCPNAMIAVALDSLDVGLGASKVLEASEA